MSSEATFRAAVSKIEQLSRKPSNEDLLQLYGLFKQATEGDQTGEPPTGFDFKGMAKYNAWNDQKGKSKETAMANYIELVETLLMKYS